MLLDHELVAGLESSNWTQEWLLAGLLTLDLCECVRYSDDGPPPDATKYGDDVFGEWVIGWAVVGAEDHGGIMGHRPVRWSADDQSVTDSGIIGNRVDIAAADDRTDAYGDLDPSEAADRRRADAVSAGVAEAVGADIFVTNRPYLHQTTLELADGVTYCAVPDALAIIGLYQRAQGSFVISRHPSGRSTHSLNRGLYYWVGARELLPSAWRWFAACVQHSRGGGDSSLVFLGQSVLQRVQRALQVRDEVHLELNKPQDNDTADQALASLDVDLLLLMGAVDASARVAHAALGISGSAYNAGWQYEKKWVAKVAAAAPGLGGLFQEATDHIHALTILRVLRNSIHGEALSAMGVARARHRDRTVVGLPVAEQTDLLAAFAALGGNTAWGIEELIPGRMHFDPGVFLEQLLPRVLRMLNEIMEATPVEQLANVSLQPSDRQPPSSGPGSGPFQPRTRESIRWQLGL